MFSKDTVDDYKELNIKSLKRLGFLNLGYYGNLRWQSSRTKEPRGDINVQCQTGRLVLTYRSRSYGQDWEDIRDIIRLAETTPNYGGVRYWLVCPSCQARRTSLYGGKYFRCRVCRDLCYQSQLDTGWSAVMGRMYKIRHRLGDYNGIDDGFPPKPKGMRWKTYYALYDRYDTLNGHLSFAWMQRFGMLDGAYD